MANADGPERHAGGQEQGPEEAVLEEPGEAAGGIEQVERVAGRRRVDHHHVEVARLDQLVELLHGHVLLGAREGTGQVLVEPVGQDPLGLVRACGRRCGSGRRRCPWCRASGRGDGPASRPATSVGVLGRDCTPKESASRRAGSTVTTQARRPARAAARAKVAETVVLPTPPEPQQTMTERSVTKESRARSRRRDLGDELADGLGQGRAPAGRSRPGRSSRPAGGDQELGQGEVAGQPLDLARPRWRGAPGGSGGPPPGRSRRAGSTVRPGRGVLRPTVRGPRGRGRSR